MSSKIKEEESSSKKEVLLLALVHSIVNEAERFLIVVPGRSIQFKCVALQAHHMVRAE